jgi:hypothetical protein
VKRTNFRAPKFQKKMRAAAMTFDEKRRTGKTHATLSAQLTVVPTRKERAAEIR